MNQVSVLGAGAWGTTLAQVLSDAGNEVILWARDKQIVDEINRHKTNQKYLGRHILPNSIRATNSIEEVFSFSDFHVFAILSHAGVHTVFVPVFRSRSRFLKHHESGAGSREPEQEPVFTAPAAEPEPQKSTGSASLLAANSKGSNIY